MIELKEWQFGVRDRDSLEEVTLRKSHAADVGVSFEHLLAGMVYRGDHGDQILPELCASPKQLDRFLALCHQVADNVDEIANILGVPVERIEEAADKESVAECEMNEYYRFPFNEYTEAVFQLESRFAEEVTEVPA